MLVSPLKNNFQLSLIILLGVSLLLWILSFNFENSPNFAITNNILYDALFLNIQSVFAKRFIVFLCITIGAFMINYLAINEEIISKNNYLPAFLYILFGFSACSATYIEPALVANLVLIPAIYFIISTYRTEGVLTPFYNAGLFLGIVLFLNTYFIFLLPVAFIALFIMRSYVWREWLIMLIGILTPIYLFMMLCYLNNEGVFKFWNILQLSIQITSIPSFSEYYIPFLFLTGFTAMLAIINYVSKGFGNKIKTTKTKYILMWFLFISFFLGFYNQKNELFFLPSIIPLSIIIGDYLGEIKQLKIANTLLFLIISSFLVVFCHALKII